MIKSSEVKKKVFDLYRESTIDGFENCYIIKEMKNVKGYFDKKEIPEEFQQIILKVYLPRILASVDAEELFFDQEYKLLHAGKNNNSERMIKGSAVPKFHDNTMINRNTTFKTKLEYKTISDVLEFINDLEKSGYMQAYIEVLKELSGVEVERIKYASPLSEKLVIRQRTNK